MLLTQGATAQSPSPPLPAVTTVVVKNREVAPTAEFVGRVEAIGTFRARARVEGFLQKVTFKGGEDLKAGELLYVIEPAPYKAQLASSRAQLEQAQARLREAEQALARVRALGKDNAISRAEIEQAVVGHKVAQAQVLAAGAAVQTAKLNLSYTRITSPIDGRIGITAITEGNLVGPSSGVLATVVQLEPIRVVFSLSGRDLLAALQQFNARSPSELVGRYVARVRLPIGEIYPHPGRLEFVGNEVDPDTGTVAVRTVFPNPDNILLPGQFVTVLVRPRKTKRYPMVPLTAVQRNQEGAFVLVLDDANRVVQRQIETSVQIGQQIVVKQGLQAGETVIVGGLQKVQPGMTVQPVSAPPN
ncbi:MAG TPA: efflux RND transporter periplasmic adaptor subunit [Gammaproteobacteria bacterium]|nr:efflux RND transporter periplasmic adaptor subunit [Gammaproteobacteria bacterium]